MSKYDDYIHYCMSYIMNEKIDFMIINIKIISLSSIVLSKFSIFNDDNDFYII